MSNPGRKSGNPSARDSEASLLRLWAVVLSLVAACTLFRDYWEYSAAYFREPRMWAVFLEGSGPAPAQYRMGVLRAAQFLSQHVHLPHVHLQMRHSLALIDGCALGITLPLLLSLLRRSTMWHSAALAEKVFAAAALVGLLQYALFWLTWYQRPETLTISALTVATVWLCTHRLQSAWWNALLLLACALALGFVRADAGFALNVGFALMCLTAYGRQMALPRWAQFVVNLLGAGLSGAAQVFVMKQIYPHASYGDTPVFQLLLNLKNAAGALPFLFFMAPVFWLVYQVATRRFTLRGAHAGLLAGAALFMLMWFVAGRVEEVRIFMPFTLALLPMMTEAAMQRMRALTPATR